MTCRIFSMLSLVALLPSCESSKTEASIAVSVPAQAQTVLPEEVSFNAHIQPILSEYCYHCHGPDAKTRKPDDAPLRLDRPEDAFALREEGHPVILKGKPLESSLLKRIHSVDPDTIMPPPESHKVMKPEEIALIERWIQQGAEYEPHWAFAPVKKPSVPSAGSAWAVNPIDHFIAEKLDESGLPVNPMDDSRRFHRRLAIDLTGLPPLPEETDRFIESYKKDANAAVDQEAMRLLETTASAEHFARHWLDAARYADTHGIHIDNYRAIWPYRDWVIRAFEKNMPWDQFTTEQIAGDLLPNHSLDQLVASGFNRCLATTGEGGAIAEEYDAVYAKDRVETVSAIWLGLTTGCAACHDHKFDPILTKEFYSLTAFFRNSTMAALDKNDANHPPSVFVPELKDRDSWKELEVKVQAQEKRMEERKKEARVVYDKWLVDAKLEPRKEVDSTLHLYLPMHETSGPLEGFVDGKAVKWPTKMRRVNGLIGKARLISGESLELGDLGNFESDDQVSFGGLVRIEGKPTGVIIARMDPEKSFRGWSLELDQGKPVVRIVHHEKKIENRVISDEPLKPGEWHHLMVVYDGKKASHQSTVIKVDGQQVDTDTNPNTAGGDIDAKVPLRIGAYHGEDRGMVGQVAFQEFRFYRRNLPNREIKNLAHLVEVGKALAIASKKRTDQQSEILYDYFISNVDSQSLELRKQLDELYQLQSPMKERGSISLVMDEKKEEPYAHVLERGVYTSKGEKVGPGTLAVLPPLPAGAPNNRLGLAQWLNDPANPLPARVTMNRVWYYFFGTGIVETNADFGIMGARPSHPKLLDWLAAEFIDSKWDYRNMVHKIVTSATYRQSGKVTAEKLERDPANRLLSRGPRYRLDAEQIRDLALASSGMLSRKVGGAPVKPYQPDGVWQAVAMPQSNTKIYKEDTGEALYRRSLYTIWKRTAPPPSMEIFNAPTRESFCVQRDRTNTPLQALVLLNDPQFVEASRGLATRAITEANEFGGRLDFITMRLINRCLSNDEKEVVRKTYAHAFDSFKATPDDAKLFVSTGESEVPAKIDIPELAAWTLIASQILNLDETITR